MPVTRPHCYGYFYTTAYSFVEAPFSVLSQTAHETDGSVLRSISFHFPVKMKSIFPFLQVSQTQIPWLALSGVWYLYLFMTASYVSLLPVILHTNCRLPKKLIA